MPLGEKQPLFRPEHADQIWSMDFVFDRSADGRVIKCLTIVDDATHECMAIVPERAIGGSLLTRRLDRLHITRELPQIIHTDNGKEFCGRAMLSWAYGRGVKLRLIEPGKSNQRVQRRATEEVIGWIDTHDVCKTIDGKAVIMNPGF